MKTEKRASRWMAGAWIAWCAVTLTGCSSVLGDRSAASDDAGLLEMKRRILELQQQAAVSEVEVEHLRREVAELRAALGIAARRPSGIPTTAPRPEVGTSAPALAVPEVAVSEPVAPSGGIEVSDLPASTSRPVALPPATADEPPPPVPLPEPVASAPDGEVSSEIPPAAQALYDEGYTLYHQGRYLDAEAVFQRFLGTYGALDLTDNALYWIGECRYARGDFEGALASFQETAARFPNGNKVPAALLKSGRCLESLGDFAGAKRAYDEVTSRFPDDPVAAVARQRIEQIR